MLSFPDNTLVAEVGPRDGLQSFHRWVETDDKVRMIDRLSDAGLPVIEVTGFAHPRVIPNLRDAEEVCARIKRRPGTTYRALVPNARGAERAVKAGLDELLGLITVSQSYLKKNQNMTREEGLDQAAAAFRITDAAGQGFVMAVGVALWDAYEGTIPAEDTVSVVATLRNAGIRRFYIAGSMGMEDPRQVNAIYRRLTGAFPDCTFGYHAHNLAGTATANILAALDGGAAFIEGAICGIGGGIAMPTTVGSVGNFPTEDLVTMLDQIGVRTGLDPDEIVTASRDIAAILSIDPKSHTGAGATRREVQEAARTHGRDHPA